MEEYACGCSVTQRIKQIQQPYGGYLNPNKMEKTALKSVTKLHRKENVPPSLVGLAVDYLTRYMSGASAEEAFKISLLGAEIYAETDTAQELLRTIWGLDDGSIVAALQLVCFDSCYRAGVLLYDPFEDMDPDPDTIHNIRLMVYRALAFFETYGPKVLDGFTFEGGYTDIVSTGDGDFTTADTLWDFKVSKYPPTKEHTLQLIMYWRMGLHSIHKEFQGIKFLGIYNPRLNTVYRISVDAIPEKYIEKIEKKVIGYKD